tara:strand:+ start:2027 stop:2944 length:918 start_codon:yes stop_codon:yes gene_type:complete
MKILLIGSTGQLGREIIKSSPNDICLITPSKFEFDLKNTKECYEYILNLSPDWIINSGAFTNVEKAEIEEELAYKINALGPQILAKALSKSGGKLLQISTDYVFNGKQNYPYKTDQKVSPINTYGISKAKGEEYIKQYLPSNNQSNILRTSWLVGPDGNNFALKIMQLLNDRDEIKVICDQISSPTTTLSLADAIWKTIDKNEEYSRKNKLFPSINHFCNDGVASWYDFAETIREIGLKAGLITKAGEIKPIKSNEYPSNTQRPKYSVLDTYNTKKIIGLKNSHWRNELYRCFNNSSSIKIEIQF